LIQLGSGSGQILDNGINLLLEACGFLGDINQPGERDIQLNVVDYATGGLPLTPFRTDDFPGVTATAK
jgi:hypothetical protein